MTRTKRPSEYLALLFIAAFVILEIAERGLIGLLYAIGVFAAVFVFTWMLALLDRAWEKRQKS